jgi:hypothetical protein
VERAQAHGAPHVLSAGDRSHQEFKTDFRLTELQLITMGQNVVKAYGEGLLPIRPARVADGEAAAAGTV